MGSDVPRTQREEKKEKKPGRLSDTNLDHLVSSFHTYLGATHKFSNRFTVTKNNHVLPALYFHCICMREAADCESVMS